MAKRKIWSWAGRTSIAPSTSAAGLRVGTLLWICRQKASLLTECYAARQCEQDRPVTSSVRCLVCRPAWSCMKTIFIWLHRLTSWHNFVHCHHRSTLSWLLGITQGYRSLRLVFQKDWVVGHRWHRDAGCRYQRMAGLGQLSHSHFRGLERQAGLSGGRPQVQPHAPDEQQVEAPVCDAPAGAAGSNMGNSTLFSKWM